MSTGKVDVAALRAELDAHRSSPSMPSAPVEPSARRRWPWARLAAVAVVPAALSPVKNYMGVVTNELNTNSHSRVRGGLMGAVMAETARGSGRRLIRVAPMIGNGPMVNVALIWHSSSSPVGTVS